VRLGILLSNSSDDRKKERTRTREVKAIELIRNIRLNMRKEYTTALLRESVRRFVAQNWQVSSGNYMPRNKNGLVTFDDAITRIIDTASEDPSEHNVTLLYLVGYESESAAFKSSPLDRERFAKAFLNSYGITLVTSVEKAAGLLEEKNLPLKTKAKGVKGLTYFLRHARTKNISRPINNALSKRGWHLRVRRSGACVQKVWLGVSVGVATKSHYWVMKGPDSEARGKSHKKKQPLATKVPAKPPVTTVAMDKASTV
jgi:hypothetical protein